MNIYRVPFDFTHEEKVFGGYLSLRQMSYLVASVLSIGIFFISIIPAIIKILIFFALVSFFLMCAFLKIGMVYADRYFLRIIKYLMKKKIYIFERQ